MTKTALRVLSTKKKVRTSSRKLPPGGEGPPCCGAGAPAVFNNQTTIKFQINNEKIKKNKTTFNPYFCTWRVQQGRRKH